MKPPVDLSLRKVFLEVPISNCFHRCQPLDFLGDFLARVNDNDGLQFRIFIPQETQRVKQKHILVANRGAYNDELLGLRKQQIKKCLLPIDGGATILLHACGRDDERL
jgi:hypothetical protein